MAICCAPGCSNEATTRCPVCVKLRVEVGSHYCSQKCFKGSWGVHKKSHKAAEEKANLEEVGAVKKKLGNESTNTLAFASALAGIKVTPNPGEEKDKNFPRNLHNASEVFLRAGLFECARVLHDSTLQQLETLKNGPDGKTSHSLGRACICWGCGYCGLPSNASDVHVKRTTPAGICKSCGTGDQTNFLRIPATDGGGSEVPWMEEKARPASEDIET